MTKPEVFTLAYIKNKNKLLDQNMKFQGLFFLDNLSLISIFTMLSQDVDLLQQCGTSKWVPAEVLAS